MYHAYTTNPAPNLVENQNVLAVNTLCQRLADFTMTYAQRFHYVTNAGTFPEADSIQNLSNILFSVEPSILESTLAARPDLQETFKNALMTLLKKLKLLEAEQVALQHEQSLESTILSNLGNHFDSLENFSQYVQRNIRANRKHVLPFRYLFPMGDIPNLPEALGQGRIDPFMARIEALFEFAFRAPVVQEPVFVASAVSKRLDFS